MAGENLFEKRFFPVPLFQKLLCISRISGVLFSLPQARAVRSMRGSGDGAVVTVMECVILSGGAYAPQSNPAGATMRSCAHRAVEISSDVRSEREEA